MRTGAKASPVLTEPPVSLALGASVEAFGLAANLPCLLTLSPQGSACSVVERRRTSSDGPQASPAFSTSSSRTPSASDVGEEVSTEAHSRDMGPEGQPGLENSESLSDSLYDSLSSCGSQG